MNRLIAVVLLTSCTDADLERRVTDLESRVAETERQIDELRASETDTEPPAPVEQTVEQTVELEPSVEPIEEVLPATRRASRPTGTRPTPPVAKPKEVPVFATDRTAAPFTLKTLLPGFAGTRNFSTERFVGATAKKRKKAMLFYFVSASCQWCLDELSTLAGMQDYNGRYGLGVVLISVDKDAGDIEAFRRAADVEQSDFVLVSDRYNVVKKRYGVKRLPHAFLLDGNGVILAEFVGGTEKMKRTLKSQVGAALR